MTYEYKNKCNKVSMVSTEFFQDVNTKNAGAKGNKRSVSSEKKAKIAKTIRTEFFYDGNKCNFAEPKTRKASA